MTKEQLEQCLQQMDGDTVVRGVTVFEMFQQSAAFRGRILHGVRNARALPIDELAQSMVLFAAAATLGFEIGRWMMETEQLERMAR